MSVSIIASDPLADLTTSGSFSSKRGFIVPPPPDQQNENTPLLDKDEEVQKVRPSNFHSLICRVEVEWKKMASVVADNLFCFCISSYKQYVYARSGRCSEVLRSFKDSGSLHASFLQFRSWILPSFVGTSK